MWSARAPTHYDAFRLQVSRSYRETFAGDLAKVLAQKDWRVVRNKAMSRSASGNSAQLEPQLN
jgi:hypothetical protein